MRSADTIAALSAIKHGIDKALEQEKVEVLRVAAEVGVKSFTTPWGAVTIAQSDEEWRVQLDEAGFLAWVQMNAPDQVETFTPEPVTRVKALYRAQFVKGLVRVGESVISQDSGEIVEFATPSFIPAGNRYVTYPASKQQKAAKETVEAWVSDAAQMLTDGLLERTAIEAMS